MAHNNAEEDEVKDSINYIETNLSDLWNALVTLFFYVFGSSLAMVISYTHNNSILWTIGHGFLSWVYVIYFGIFK